MMEHMIDYDELEADLHGEEDPNKKTWFNETVWKTLGLLMTIFCIQYAANTIHFMGGTWTWDHDTFFLLLIGAVPSLIIIGLKVEMGQKKFIQKRRLLRYRESEIADLQLDIEEKDGEIKRLKRELNDACETLEANRKAREEAGK